ncbi:hypothetical protein HDU97_002596 [Phlyctochytrium planicorne]|nr:hypothetical protein HDU97_002596 [Phlyctochytrium planicorne]
MGEKRSRRKKKEETESDEELSDITPKNKGRVAKSSLSEDDSDDSGGPSKKSRVQKAVKKALTHQASTEAEDGPILPDTFPFLEALTHRENNNREWMFEHKERCDKIKEAFLAFIEDLFPVMKGIDPRLPDLPPKSHIFRLNRDVRFGWFLHDSTVNTPKGGLPYKTSVSAAFPKKPPADHPACFYLHIQHDDSFLAGGIWQPEPAVLARIRRNLDNDDAAALQRVLDDASFKEQFGDTFFDTETLKTAPKGYAKDNPNIKFLRLKGFTVKKKIAQEDVLSPDFLDIVASVFRVMHSFIEVMNEYATAE